MYQPSMKPASFVAGERGPWKIDRMVHVTGTGLPPAARLAVHSGEPAHHGGAFVLRGVAGHVRYVERTEKAALDPVSPPLARAEATHGAFIPIRKSEAWWALTQDERRAILEGRSHHISSSMKYLPRIARRLYHARDLGEPFDFLTWFEFAPEHAAAFDDLLGTLRATEEWSYVEREVEVRLTRA